MDITITPNNPKKIIYIDASSLKNDFLCDRKYLLHIIRGWTNQLRAANYKAGYGTAFHAFVEQYYATPAAEREKKLESLVAVGLKSYEKYAPFIDYSSPNEFRTPEHLEKTIRAYHARYQRGDSLVPLSYDIPAGTKSLLETKFCIPWYEDENIIIYLTGTIDMICDYHGRPIIVDHKTSHQSPAYIPKFFEGFRMNIQTQFYVWIFKRLTGMDKYLPIMINGIFIKLWTLKSREKKNDFDGASFQRSQLIEYSPEEMEQFEDWLTDALAHIKAIAKHFHNEELLGPPNYSACDKGFGGKCEFCAVCSEARSLQLKILHSKYQREQYSPLNFHD